MEPRDLHMATPAPDLAAPEVLPRPTIRPREKVAMDLGGDELIQVTIRPSVWFIALVSYKWVFATLAIASLLVITAGGVLTTAHSIIFQLLSISAVARVGVATLQWASRLYVLTNRRILCFRGVLQVEKRECPLDGVGEAQLLVAGLQAQLGLGTLRVVPSDPEGSPPVALQWTHIARPREIHERVLRAIQNARSGRS